MPTQTRKKASRPQFMKKAGKISLGMALGLTLTCNMALAQIADTNAGVGQNTSGETINSPWLNWPTNGNHSPVTSGSQGARIGGGVIYGRISGSDGANGSAGNGQTGGAGIFMPNQGNLTVHGFVYGGNGGNYDGTGNFGGHGGHGIAGNSINITNYGAIYGGHGGISDPAKSGGNGGSGIYVSRSGTDPASTIINYGTITGGKFGTSSSAGSGGSAIAITGDGNRVINAGHLEVFDNASAIGIDGDGNTIELRDGYRFSILSNSAYVSVTGAGNGIALGGNKDSTLHLNYFTKNLYDMGTTPFIQKIGNSTWTIAGVLDRDYGINAHWDIQQGGIIFAESTNLALETDKDIIFRKGSTLHVGNANARIDGKNAVAGDDHDGALVMEAGAIMELHNNGGTLKLTSNGTGAGVAHVSNTINVTLATNRGWEVGKPYVVVDTNGSDSFAGFNTIVKETAMRSYSLHAEGIPGGTKSLLVATIDRLDTAHSFGTTYNQRNVGAAVDSLLRYQESEIYDTMVNLLTRREVVDALEQLSGGIHASTKSVLMEQQRKFTRDISNHLAGNAANRAGFTDSLLAAGQASTGGGLWVSPSYSSASLDYDGNAAKTTWTTWDVTLGYDHMMPHGWFVGGAARLAETDIKVKKTRSRSDVSSYSFALYGGKETDLGPGSLRVTAGGVYGRHSVDTKRNVSFGNLHNHLKTDYNANSWQVFGEVAYTISMSDSIILEPFVSLEWGSIHTAGFTETGGITALYAKSHSDDYLTSTAGLRSYVRFNNHVALRAYAGWQHAYNRLEPRTTLAFARERGDNFHIRGNAIQENALVVGAGLEFSFTENLMLSVSYDGTFGDQGQNHAGTVMLVYTW